jgi:hypothetical protein
VNLICFRAACRMPTAGHKNLKGETENMGFRIFSRIRVLAVSLAAVTATTTLFAIAGAAGPAAAAASNGCPASKTVGTLPTASNVAAGFSNSGSTTTYTFSSLTNENPVGGVPGLIKYCVYPSPSALPASHTVAAKGADGAPWGYGTGSNNFAFVRPGGDKTNIALDGTTGITMGTATWSTLPASQTIILHINDPTVCASLFGSGTSATCFVKPSTGPICDHGDSSVAYNAMPFDVVNCLNPGVAFEANGWNEFGDSVTISGTGRTLKSLTVDFQSFACVTGTWDNQGGNNLCGGGATPGVSPGTFTWPITANIYAADSSGLPTGSPIATTGPLDEQIPFRPNADSTNCSSTPTKWFNPLAPGGGACQNSIATKLTFDSFTAPGGGPVGPLPADGKVVWTVAFNTSTSGYTPQGAKTPPCTLTAAAVPTPVCPQNPADSLNVGDHSLPNAPYAGTSLFDTNGGLAVGSKSPPAAGLTFIAPDDGGRPLGEIITTP